MLFVFELDGMQAKMPLWLEFARAMRSELTVTPLLGLFRENRMRTLAAAAAAAAEEEKDEGGDDLPEDGTEGDVEETSTN
jgi:hypothetical protein